MTNPKAEYEAAYFTLLRAREELEHLHVYSRHLDQEASYLTSQIERLHDWADDVPAKFRRLVDTTINPTAVALGQRKEVVETERARVPDRIQAQRDFVAECEAETSLLREAI